MVLSTCRTMSASCIFLGLGPAPDWPGIMYNMLDAIPNQILMMPYIIHLSLYFGTVQGVRSLSDCLTSCRHS